MKKKKKEVKKYIKEHFSYFKYNFEQIFTLAGKQLAEVVILIRCYYGNDGIIFSGGVLQETSSSSFLITEVENQLQNRCFELILSLNNAPFY